MSPRGGYSLCRVVFGRWGRAAKGIVLWLGGSVPLAALAWGSGGHMIVAQIAYEHMNSTAKSQADALLAVSITPAGITARTSSFVQAAHWADDVRPLASFDEFKPLHFIDLPFSADGTALPKDQPSQQNIEWALEKYVGILKSKASIQDKAEALRFVIHFVGDIHQPLHCATQITSEYPQGDRGGNFFMIGYRDDQNHHHKVKLHSFWDAGGESFPKMQGREPPDLAEVAAAAKDIGLEHPESTEEKIHKDGPEAYTQWAAESAMLAQTVAYFGIQDGADISAHYQAATKDTSRERVAWAGYRLAELLNSLWK